jgi:hypothetical protein
MYKGLFQLLPKNIQGHEGLGIVTKVGKSIRYAKEGDYVATRGEPAFADYYNCNEYMFVKVPEADPKYIIEPVACGINIARGLKIETDDPILLLGSGFLSTIIFTMMRRYYSNQIFVVGRANEDFWSKQENIIHLNYIPEALPKFKYIIDVSDKPEYLDMNLYAECAQVILAAEKHPPAILTFGNFLWNAVNVKFPSPRNYGFLDAMVLGRDLIEEKLLKTSSLWTKAYDRNTEVKLAFEEGSFRPVGYSRGYIKW